MADSNHVFGVILAGGGGTRLWPKSRNKTPKQFLKLAGEQTMMQLAASRLTKIIPWDRIIVVTNEIYRQEVKVQLPEVPLENIIAEPEKRDTALAMLTGALFAYSKDPDAVVINGASDHIVADEKEFIRVMSAAVEVAAAGEMLVTVGITPTFPTSAFGYIKIGPDFGKVSKDVSVFKVDSFTEKPNVATARAFISTGKYFWNANMYVWSSRTLQAAFAQHMPEMHDLTLPLATMKPAAFHAALPEVYKKAQSISIDYAISEKADNLVLIPGDFGWNDVGDWQVVYDLGTKNQEGNVIISDSDQSHVLTIGSGDNLIHTNGRLVALVGINDMLVVDTDEIIMIAPKNRSQDVKKLVEQLKENNQKEYL